MVEMSYCLVLKECLKPGFNFPSWIWWGPLGFPWRASNSCTVILGISGLTTTSLQNPHVPELSSCYGTTSSSEDCLHCLIPTHILNGKVIPMKLHEWTSLITANLVLGKCLETRNLCFTLLPSRWAFLPPPHPQRKCCIPARRQDRACSPVCSRLPAPASRRPCLCPLPAWRSATEKSTLLENMCNRISF